MKIAIIAAVCNNHSGARSPIELAISLAQKKHHIFFYCTDHLFDESVYALLQKRRIIVRVISRRLSRVSQYTELISCLKNDNPDIISLHTFFGFAFIASFLQKPTIVTYYGSQWNPFMTPNRKDNVFLYISNVMANALIWLKTIILLYRVTGVVAISEYTKDETSKFYGKRSISIPIGGGTLFKKNKIAHHKQITLLSVSRIVPYKNFHILIAIIRRISTNTPLRLIIAGSSPHERYLEYLKKIKPDNVEIHLDVTDSDLIRLYQSADIYVSADRYLFFGMPILEAAAYHIPSVSFDYCAAHEVIKSGKTGFVVSTSSEFVTALQLLIDKKQLRIRLGNNAARFSKKNFNWLTTADMYEKTFQKIITRSI